MISNLVASGGFQNPMLLFLSDTFHACLKCAEYYMGRL